MAWTDERIDDAFGLLRDEMRETRSEMRTEIRELRGEMRSEFQAVRADISAGQRQQTMIGWAIAAALMAQLIAFVVTQS